MAVRSKCGVVRDWEIPVRAGRWVLSPRDVDFEKLFGNQADRCRALMDLIYSPSIETDDRGLGDWIELHSASTLKPALGSSYINIIEACIMAKLIEYNTAYKYAAGDHCKQYRLCKQLRHRDWERAELVNTRLVNQRRRRLTRVIEELPAEYQNAALTALAVEIEDAPDGVLRRLAVETQKKKDPPERVDERIKIYRQQIESVRYCMTAPKTDAQGRLYTSIVNLKKGLRPYLRLGGQRLREADIKSSQPAFLGHRIQQVLDSNVTAFLSAGLDVEAAELEQVLGADQRQRLAAVVVGCLTDPVAAVLELYRQPEVFLERFTPSLAVRERVRELDWRNFAGWPEPDAEILRVMESADHWLRDIRNGELYERTKSEAGYGNRIDLDTFKHRRFFPYIFGANTSAKPRPVMRAIQKLYPGIDAYVACHKSRELLKQAYTNLISDVGCNNREVYRLFRDVCGRLWARLPCELQAEEARFVFGRWGDAVNDAGLLVTSIHDALLAKDREVWRIKAIFRRVVKETGLPLVVGRIDQAKFAEHQPEWQSRERRQVGRLKEISHERREFLQGRRFRGREFGNARSISASRRESRPSLQSSSSTCKSTEPVYDTHKICPSTHNSKLRHIRASKLLEEYSVHSSNTSRGR